MRHLRVEIQDREGVARGRETLWPGQEKEEVRREKQGAEKGEGGAVFLSYYLFRRLGYKKIHLF